MAEWTNLSQNFTFSTGKDPKVDNWIMLGSPVPVLTLTGAYLVGVQWLGPYLMSKRKPFDLKGFIIAYNLYQIIWAGYNISMPFWKANVWNCLKNYCQQGEIVNLVDDDFLFLSWGFFFSKVIDLFDTVIFVLRKKQTQITFLHVYHHSVIVLSAWFHVKFIQDPAFTILMLLNHGVHFIMYQYYLLTALGPKFAKYLWWKQYMTRIQLVQFLIVIAYIATIWIRGCHITKELAVYIIVNDILLIFLFGNFYIQTYIKKYKKTA